MSPPPISNSKKKLIYKFILIYITKLCFLIEGLIKTFKEQPYCKLLCRPRSELPRHFYRSKMSGAGRGGSVASPGPHSH